MARDPTLTFASPHESILDSIITHWPSANKVLAHSSIRLEYVNSVLPVLVTDRQQALEFLLDIWAKNFDINWPHQCQTQND